MPLPLCFTARPRVGGRRAAVRIFGCVSRPAPGCVSFYRHTTPHGVFEPVKRQRGEPGRIYRYRQADEYRATLQRRPAPARNAHMCCGREPARFTCSISTSAVHDRAASIVCEIEQRCEPRRSARRRRFSQLDRRHGRRDDYLGTASHSAAGIAPCAAGRGVSCRCCAGKLSRFASWQRLRLVAAGVNHPMGRTCRPNL